MKRDITCYRVNHAAEAGISERGIGNGIGKKQSFEAQTFPAMQALCRTALYMTKSESDAQSIVMETYVRAYRSFDESRFGPTCRSWLFKIMADFLPNENCRFHGSSVETSGIAGRMDNQSECSRLENRYSIDDFGQVALSTISEDHVTNAVRNLPLDLRLVVVLSLIEGFSYHDICYILGINTETVSSRLQYGRSLMRGALVDRLVYESSRNTTPDRVKGCQAD